MAKGNQWITDYLNLLFIGTATPTANIAQNAAAPITNLYASLHTADPGAAGNQTTSETSTGNYTGYARVAVARSVAGFTVSGQSVTLAANVTFAQAPVTATDVLTHWAIGTASSGTGQILYSGPIGTNLGAGTGLNGNNITIPGSTLAVNERVTFQVPTGGVIPTGLTAGTVYYVKTASSDVITVSTTAGGAVVAITADGQLLCYKVTPVTLGGGILVTPQLTTSTTITEL